MRPAIAALIAVFATAAFAGEPPTEPILRIEAGMHTASIQRIGIDGAGRTILSASQDKSARIWDLKTGALLRVLRPPIGSGDEGKLHAGALSPDGRLAAVAGWTGWDWDGQSSIYFFDTASGAMVRRIGGLTSAITQLVFTADGRNLGVGLGNNGVRVFRTADGELVFSDPNYTEGAYGADFDLAGRLATTSSDGLVRLYDAAGKLLAKEPLPHGKDPTGIAFSPDGSRLAVGFDDSHAVDVISGDNLKFLYAPETAKVNDTLGALRWSRDGEVLAVAGRYRAGDELLRRYADGGRGAATDVAVCGSTVMDIQALVDGSFVYCSADPVLGRLARDGTRTVLQGTPLADHRGPALRASEDGTTIGFGFVRNGQSLAAFSTAERALKLGAFNLPAPATSAAGLAITGLNTAATKLNGQPLKLNQWEVSRSLALSPGAVRFLLGADWSLRLFEQGGRELWKKPTPGSVWAVTFASAGRLAIAAFGDGTIRWFRVSDGQELLAFFPHADQKRWVLWTPSGYYDASAGGGEELIGWHVNRGKDHEADFFPAARFRSRFYRPDIVSRILTTLDETAAVSLADEESGHKKTAQAALVLPPVVHIVSPSANAAFDGPSMQVRVQVRSPSGNPITAVRALVDGRPVGEQRGVKKKDGATGENELTLTVPLPPRDCEVAVLAEAGDAVGEPDRVKLHYAAAPAEAVQEFLPKLYVLAIGVSDYANPELKLDYPAKDARDLAAMFKKQKGKLFREVTVKVLTDEEATKDEIIDALDWLQKQTTSRDVAVLFMAGHGVNDPSSGVYQFLPVKGNPDKRSTLLPGTDIKTTLSAIAGKAVVMLDTCHAGNVLGGKKFRGGNDQNGFVNELASAESGVVVFTAATGKQSSQESKEWNNGAFTKALIEALSGEADGRKTGRVTVNMIDLYVSERVKELTHGQQTPVTAKPGGVPDFPLASH